MTDADIRPVPGLVVRLCEQWIVIGRVEALRVYYAEHSPYREYPRLWWVETERWPGMLARAIAQGAKVEPPEA